MGRLSGELVERQIAEMFSALAGLDASDPDHTTAVDQAHKVERDLRARLKAQDLLDNAAPDLLEALKSIENDCGCIPKAIWDLRNQAIAKATGESVGNLSISPTAPGRSYPLAGGSVAPGANLGGREGSGR